MKPRGHSGAWAGIGRISSARFLIVRRQLARLACISFVLSFSGCSLWQENLKAEGLNRAQTIEPLLADAGFTRRNADTPAKVAHMQSLTPFTMRYHMKNGVLRYSFADPEQCHCIYVGDQIAYERYKALKAERQQVQQQTSAYQSIQNEELSEETGIPQMGGFDSVWSDSSP
jgi:hypothetical protein